MGVVAAVVKDAELYEHTLRKPVGKFGRGMYAARRNAFGYENDEKERPERMIMERTILLLGHASL